MHWLGIQATAPSLCFFLLFSFLPFGYPNALVSKQKQQGETASCQTNASAGSSREIEELIGRGPPILVPLHFTNITSWSGSVCEPNDVFNIFPGQYDPFAVKDFFQITVGFGELSLSEAKMIDVAWDLIVGRVGQVILAFCTWKAFSTYVRNSMHRHPVTYSTFWTAFMDGQPSMYSTLHLMRDGAFGGVGQSRASMAFFAIAMPFVLAFPTMASTMTGYRAKAGAFVTDSKNNLMAVDSFVPVLYAVHDGQRINLTENYMVTIGPWQRITRAISRPSDFEGTKYQTYTRSCSRNDPLCASARYVSDYAQTYGFMGLDSSTGRMNNIETQFNGIRLPSPALNISAFYIPGFTVWFGKDWIDPRTNTQPFEDIGNARFLVSRAPEETYTLDYIQEHGSCQALEAYQWGFSYLQIIVVSAMLFVWTIGICLTWTKAHLSLLQQANPRVPTKYEATIMLASDIHLSLRPDNKPDVHQSIDRCINQDLKGGRISVFETTNPTDVDLWKELSNWIKHNKWWFAGLIILTPYSLFGWALAPLALFVFVVVLNTAIILALANIRTPREIQILPSNHFAIPKRPFPNTNHRTKMQRIVLLRQVTPLTQALRPPFLAAVPQRHFRHVSSDQSASPKRFQATGPKIPSGPAKPRYFSESPIPQEDGELYRAMREEFWLRRRNDVSDGIISRMESTYQSRLEAVDAMLDQLESRVLELERKRNGQDNSSRGK
ncbi:hypothetical protein QBC34DRAFT_474791 [Podospora aff. communis PSN243]|uniref:Uncharacterized protein n=1 Tax=Podospora aff. communis PSN243 TaxID=3040156 RepID=A0AAV9GBD7_9PEZI|nr:hypothetical protein QBC34DRAFT_474791 [Podospora aff. communis PSN243]